MLSQTFKAEMAVGSWDGTPLMPNISEAVRIMETKMVRGDLPAKDGEPSGDMDTT